MAGRSRDGSGLLPAADDHPGRAVQRRRPVDVLGRMLAEEFQARSDVTVVVENKTGGAGNIGIEAVRNAVPGGTTLLLIPTGNLTINPVLMQNLRFDVERDLAPIALLASAPNVLVVSPKLGVGSI
jgi:tripartite-type tricarboxylate transporter receptor subunit TctC